jgi:hypothetical protein
MRIIATTIVLACIVLLSKGLFAQQVAQAQSRVPVADFFRPPLLAKPALSPNGRYLAGAVTPEGKRTQLVVIDLQDLGHPKQVAGFNNADIYSYAWVNDQRIVFDVIDRESGAGRPLQPGLWAVDRDGGNYRQLINSFWSAPRDTATMIVDRRLPWEWRLHSVLTDGSNDVLVQGLVISNTHEVADIRLARLDTMTGISHSLGDGAPHHVTRWLVDRQGQPKVVTTWNEGRFRAFVKSDTDATWVQWQDAEGYTGKYVIPFWIGVDGQLLVLARSNRDTLALYATDTRTRELKPEPMLTLDGYDLRAGAEYDGETGRLLGIHYETDARGTVWLDPVMKATQAAIDALLPATVNRIDCWNCASVPTMLVTAASDRQPAIYYVYNRDTKVLTPVTASRPWIKPQSMGPARRIPLRCARWIVDPGPRDTSAGQA